jgi:Arc/MetJ-type ribon-helix-helix transcriptional regulator
MVSYNIMTNKQINIRLPEKFHKKILRYMKNNNYLSIQDLIKELLRDKICDERKQKYSNNAKTNIVSDVKSDYGDLNIISELNSNYNRFVNNLNLVIKNQNEKFDEVINEMQKHKMKELWDNEEDEFWENI